MANNYNMDLIVRGTKKSLDELQAILKQEIDEGQTPSHWYTMGKTLRRIGYDPEKMDVRAYTDSMERLTDDELQVLYVGAWSPQPQVLIAIRMRWPDLTIQWQGVDEFGQSPMTNDPSLVGKYRIEDDDDGLNPFTELGEWVGEEALPVINRHYGTDCKTLQEAFDSISKLQHTDQMALYEEDEDDVEAVREAIEPAKKVYVVTFINDCEWELPNVSVQVFGSLDAARKCLDEEWQTLTSETEYDEDVSKKDDDDFLFEDHCANRTIGEIKEREIRDE